MTLTPPPEKLVLEEVKSGADPDRFSREKDTTPEHSFRLVDPTTGRVCGFVVVDDTRRGPGLGGIRVAPDLTLEEVRRLARAMTLKNSAACLPYGGGKAGLIQDPAWLAGYPEIKREWIQRLAEALFDLESYVPAPDMGTDERDIQQIYDYFSERLGTREHKRGGAARPPEQGGIPIDAWALTAHSLYAAIQTVAARAPEFTVKGSRVVIQGFGAVGAGIAEKLHQAGARIVGVSDITAALYHSQGLDWEALQRARPAGKLMEYGGPAERRFPPEKIDWLLEAPCDLLIPAARPDAITARNADRIQCRRIFQGANTPVNKMTEYYLWNRRGIPSYSDFIVNVGGVMGCAVELEMTADPDYRQQVLGPGGEGRVYIEELIYNTVRNNMMDLLDRMDRSSMKDVIFREEALALALARLESPSQVWL